MKIEHVAIQVSDPAAMADWYARYLGCTIARSGGPPANARFIRDSAGAVLLELYNNPALPVPDYRGWNPGMLHLAFVSNSPAADRDRLLTAGATLAEDLVTSPAGDQFVMLRDPWGIALQLAYRTSPMLR
jgi:glyoxylase I family protein